SLLRGVRDAHRDVIRADGARPPSRGDLPHPAAAPTPSARLHLRLTAAGALTTAVAVFAWVWFAYLPAFNTAHTAVEGAPVPTARVDAPPAPPGRLVFVVVDGLGWDEARAMDELAPLRAHGVSRMLEVEFPSYTYPALTSLVTGVEPRDSGVRLNGDWEGAVGLDSVPRLAGAAGVPVEVRSRGWKPFEELMRPPGSAVVLRGRLQRLLALREEERSAYRGAGASGAAASATAETGQGAAATSGRPEGDAGARRALILEYVEEVDHAGTRWAHGTPRT
ncbi:MAG: alkaline phosphatase family protein, partial [Polyangiaceae bacterium]